jgi:hypothetical protein
VEQGGRVERRNAGHGSGRPLGLGRRPSLGLVGRRGWVGAEREDPGEDEPQGDGAALPVEAGGAGDGDGVGGAEHESSMSPASDNSPGPSPSSRQIQGDFGWIRGASRDLGT